MESAILYNLEVEEPSQKVQTILGLDPGKDKCGVAVMNQKFQVLWHEVVNSSKALFLIREQLIHYDVSLIVLGDGTTSQKWHRRVSQQIPQTPIHIVDERNSTLEARDRYWHMYPPTGFQRLIPLGMRLPPRPVDDIVAILLIERYLKSA